MRSGTPLMTMRLIGRLLAPVLLVGLEHELDAGVHAHEPIGPEPHRLALEALLADLLDVLLGHDPGGAGGRRGIERQEVRPGRVQHEAHAVRVDDLHRLHPLVQELGRGAPVALEAELHVLGREGIAVVEPEALAQLELVHEPVRALLPGLGQARRHVVAGQRLDQRVVQRIEKHERRADPRGLGGIEKRGGDRGVEGDGELAVRLGLRPGLSTRHPQDDPEESDAQREPVHLHGAPLVGSFRDVARSPGPLAPVARAHRVAGHETDAPAVFRDREGVYLSSHTFL